jgi:hypothetical protein
VLANVSVLKKSTMMSAESCVRLMKGASPGLEFVVSGGWGTYYANLSVASKEFFRALRVVGEGENGAYYWHIHPQSGSRRESSARASAKARNSDLHQCLCWFQRGTRCHVGEETLRVVLRRSEITLLD